MKTQIEIIPAKHTKTFVFSSKEALFIRDILGGINDDIMENILKGSYNKSKMTPKMAMNTLYEIVGELDKEF